MREFNSTGLCVPEKHYMADVSGRVAQIRAMVEKGDYFCIDRPQQYGKTTTLAALERDLAADFEVLLIDFQKFGYATFASEGSFVRSFCQAVLYRRGARPLPEAARHKVEALARGDADVTLRDLFWALRLWCAESARPVILVVDEVDNAIVNQVFLDFLAQLRFQYLRREEYSGYPAFQSVIFAGVTDVRFLKAKTRSAEQARLNSPWNIATDFRVDMSFSREDVVGMLVQYEADHATGMDVGVVASEIICWTGGYPFLVSRLCQLVDVNGLPWDRGGVESAVRMLLSDPNVSLFESFKDKLEAYPRLKEQLREMLMQGTSVFASPYDEMQRQFRTHGFTSVRDGKMIVANRVFETLLYDYFSPNSAGES